MNRSTIQQILRTRDGMTRDEAEELITEAKEAMQEYLENGELGLAEDVCMEFFGLEPDYLDELI